MGGKVCKNVVVVAPTNHDHVLFVQVSFKNTIKDFFLNESFLNRNLSPEMLHRIEPWTHGGSQNVFLVLTLFTVTYVRLTYLICICFRYQWKTFILVT